MNKAIFISLINQLVCIKRRDVRRSQLDVTTTLINGAKEKKDTLNHTVGVLVTLRGTVQKLFRIIGIYDHWLGM